MSAQVSDLSVGNIFEHVIQGKTVLGRPTNLATRWQLTSLTGALQYPTGIVNVAAALNTAIVANYKACLTTTWNAVQSLTFRIAESETVYPPVRSRGIYTPITAAGTRTAGTTGLDNIAAALQRYSYKSGRTEQGEIRVGPISDLDVLNDKFISALTALLATLALTLVSAVSLTLGIGTLQPVAWRIGTKAAPHQPSLSQYFGFTLGTWTSSMRRRKLDPITG